MSAITIHGIDELITRLGKAAARDVLKPPMQRSVMRLQREMATYPPQRSGSTYVRTGTLGRRWTTSVTKTAGGLKGSVGNNTSYGPFVQSHQFQARMHRGRWQTDEQVFNKNRGRIIADFEREIEKALR